MQRLLARRIQQQAAPAAPQLPMPPALCLLVSSRLVSPAQVQGRLPEGAYPLKVLQTLSDHLYNERGLRGNSEASGLLACLGALR